VSTCQSERRSSRWLCAAGARRLVRDGRGSAVGAVGAAAGGQAAQALDEVVGELVGQDTMELYLCFQMGGIGAGLCWLTVISADGGELINTCVLCSSTPVCCKGDGHQP